MNIERKNLLNPGQKPEKSYVEKCLGKREGTIIAASDYIRTFVDQISPQDYLERARKWLDTGARIVGGCCGIGPEHIAALSKGLHNS